MQRHVPILSILLAGLLCASADTVRAEEDLAARVAQLASADSSDCYEAYRALSGLRDPLLVPLLADALPRCTDYGQYYGVMLLGQYEDKLVRPVLRKLSQDPSTHLRVCAAATLHRKGDRKAARILAAALGEEGVSTATRSLMLSRIYGIDAPEVLAVVRKLAAPDQEVVLISAALYQLHNVRDKGSADTAAALLQHEQHGIRAIAGAYLHGVGDARGLDAMVAAMESGEVSYSDFSRVRSMLRNRGGFPPVLLDVLVARLEEETNTSYLTQMCETVGEALHAKAVPVLKKLLEHVNGSVAAAAFKALGRFPGAVPPETLERLLVSDDEERRLAAADALRRRDDLRGLPVVVEILRESTTQLRRSDAARLLGDFRVAAAVEPLIDALEDEYSTARSYAASSLATVLRSLFPYRRFDLSSAGYAYHTGSAQARTQAVVRIRAWWQTRKEQAGW